MPRSPSIVTFTARVRRTGASRPSSRKPCPGTRRGPSLLRPGDPVAAPLWWTSTATAVGAGGLENLIGLHNLRYFSSPALAERGRKQARRCRMLRGSHVLERETRARNDCNREIRPAYTLLFVVEVKQHALPLLFVERR